MKRKYIARLDGRPVREGRRLTSKRYTHAVVGVYADSGKSYALGWYEDGDRAHAEVKNWQGYSGWRKIVVVPVVGLIQ